MSNKRGWTLVEALVVSLLVTIVFGFINTIIRQFSKGVLRVETRVPLQHDLQVAKFAIEKDLSSAVRSTVGNVVPNPGFEDVPVSLSTTTPPAWGAWGYAPNLFYSGAVGNYFTYTVSAISSSSTFSRQGHYGLLVDSAFSSSLVFSSTFNLVSGSPYLFGGWMFRQRPPDPLGSSWDAPQMRLAWGPPGTWVGISPLGHHLLSSASLGWVFVSTTFTATNSSYNVQAGHIGNSPPRRVIFYDDIVVTPLATNITPTNGNTLEYAVFMNDPNPANQRERHRYRMVPDGVSGRIINERLVGGAWVQESTLRGIRRMLIGWDFGQAIPGQLPSPLPAAFFNNGLNFPIAILLEAGPVGAGPPKSMSLLFSVFPVTP